MDKQSFEQWFMSNIDMMAELGIMHYNSPWGRTVRLALAVNEPLIEGLSARVDVLEKALAQALEQINTHKVETLAEPEPPQDFEALPIEAKPKRKYTRRKKVEAVND